MRRGDAIELYIGCTLILALARLSDAERHMVTAHTYRGLSYVECGREANCSRQRAHNAHREGMKKLARFLTHERAHFGFEAA